MSDSEIRNKGEAPGGGSDKRSERIELSGDQARQGDIILRSPTRRRLFFGGLILCVIALIVIGLWS